MFLNGSHAGGTPRRDPRAGAPERILRILGRIELPETQMKLPGIEVPQDELHGLVYAL